MANLTNIHVNKGPTLKGAHIYAHFDDGTSLALCRYPADETNAHDGWWVEWQFVDPDGYSEWSGDMAQNKPFTVAIAEFNLRIGVKVATDEYYLDQPF